MAYPSRAFTASARSSPAERLLLRFSRTGQYGDDIVTNDALMSGCGVRVFSRALDVPMFRRALGELAILQDKHRQGSNKGSRNACEHTHKNTSAHTNTQTHTHIHSPRTRAHLLETNCSQETKNIGRTTIDAARDAFAQVLVGMNREHVSNFVKELPPVKGSDETPCIVFRCVHDESKLKVRSSGHDAKTSFAQRTNNICIVGSPQS